MQLVSATVASILSSRLAFTRVRRKITYYRCWMTHDSSILRYPQKRISDGAIPCKKFLSRVSDKCRLLFTSCARDRASSRLPSTSHTCASSSKIPDMEIHPPLGRFPETWSRLLRGKRNEYSHERVLRVVIFPTLGRSSPRHGTRRDGSEVQVRMKWNVFLMSSRCIAKTRLDRVWKTLPPVFHICNDQPPRGRRRRSRQRAREGNRVKRRPGPDGGVMERGRGEERRQRKKKTMAGKRGTERQKVNTSGESTGVRAPPRRVGPTPTIPASTYRDSHRAPRGTYI